jgi:hypothetical protein
MEPAAEFLTPPTSFISVSFTTEVRALHRDVSQRQVVLSAAARSWRCQNPTGRV